MFDPYNEQYFNPHLAYRFFATFARLEFALKESGRCQIAHGVVVPDWRKYCQELDDLTLDLSHGGLEASLKELTDDECAPLKEMVCGNDRWGTVPLPKGSAVRRSIESIKRVRNNLFHGGKYGPYSSVRNDSLMSHSLTVLAFLVEQVPDVQTAYHQQPD
jgi:hypothetical protein